MSKRRADDGGADESEEQQQQHAHEQPANKRARSGTPLSPPPTASPAAEAKEDRDPNAIQPASIVMCSHDMGPHLKLRDEGLTVVGEKGYRMIRATHGINEGAIYFEMKFLPSTPLRISGKLTSPAVRVGVSTSDGDIQAPVGYDIESFALCSVRGTKVHNAHVTEFAGEGFTHGDVIGVWLVLPTDPTLSGAAALARLKEDKERDEAERARKRKSKKGGRGAVKHVAGVEAAAQLDSEAAAVAAAAAAVAAAKPAVSDAELVQNRKFHRHSFLRFYKNGSALGGTPEQRASGLGVNAWSDKDVVRGVYFPAVSLYMGATVKMNFGPDFWCVPNEVLKGAAHAQHLQLQQQLQMQQAEAAQAAAAASAAGDAAPASSPVPAAIAAAAAAATAAAAAAAAASFSLPSPSASPPPPSLPFRHPLPRSLLTSGLFPHLDGSGSILQPNPKQVAANAAAAEEARQKAVLAAYQAGLAAAKNNAAEAMPGGSPNGSGRMLAKS